MSPTPQMSNCVNQRMEFRVFERLADRDYSPRVMAVRQAHNLKINFTLFDPNSPWKSPLPVT